jgi:anti-sigma regulatory factor (Ser/Thr protein kinase)
VTAVIALPPSLDDQSFEQVFTQLAAVPADARLLLDARHARWASPYGLTALLTLAQTRAEPPSFVMPEADDTLSYWARTGFFKQAETLFEFAKAPPRPRGGAGSQVLLEITAIGKPGDVHDVIGRIQERSQAILQGELGLDPRATMGFSMTLSEACQNVVEHAGGSGWVAVQTYKWARRLGRRVVNIAVCDAGQGFRRSLETVQQARADGRWDDAMALEDAVIRGVSRFRLKDAGRGQGLAGIRRYVGKWDGKLTVRSGTARIAIVPSWDDDKPLVERLAPFPGAQMQITIPEPAAAAAAAAAAGRASGAAP